MKRTPLLGLVFFCAAVSVRAAATNHISIKELREVRLPDVLVESVTSVTPDAQKKPKAAAYLQVQGVIGGHIRFELLLPDSWNGRFVMGGGGGFVGTIQNSARDSVNQGYATVGTDTGHQYEPGYLATWALDNLEAKVNFGYLAVHRTAEVARALIRSWRTRRSRCGETASLAASSAGAYTDGCCACEERSRTRDRSGRARGGDRSSRREHDDDPRRVVSRAR